MQTRTEYEETILKEVRKFPVEALPQVIRSLHSLKKSIFVVKSRKAGKEKSSGLCGIWKDSRNADEIINDIYSHRTGFGGRDIEL
ncbi:MAG: hypothetical protein IMF19_05705 [Proteobacteria bacterium]|nr:hypothetical protein [Pseudomonadota bacterium]